MLEEKKGIAWPFYVVTAMVIVSLFFLHSETFIKAAGAFLGFMLGNLIEDHFVKFDVRADGLSQIIKFILGMLITLAIFEGLKLILPDLFCCGSYSVDFRQTKTFETQNIQLNLK